MKNRVDEPRDPDNKANLGVILGIIVAIVIVIVIAYSYLSPRVEAPNATSTTVTSPATTTGTERTPSDMNRQTVPPSTSNPAGT